MKKTRMISVIAASLLTATVVFTGCGGGGSSTGTTGGATNSSSTTSSTASSITPKQVIVADGYILNATVTSGGETAINMGAGKYEFADINMLGNTIVSTGGINDLNENNQADANEPTAPTLKAPVNYSHITPMTTLIGEGGLTAQDIINYYNNTYGLNLNTLDFDPVIANANIKAEIVALGYILSQIQKTSAVTKAVDVCLPGQPCSSSSETTTSSSASNAGAFPQLGDSSNAQTSSSSESTCLPGQPCGSSSSEATTSSQASSSSETTALSMDTLVSAIKQGIALEDIVPADVKSVVESIKANEKAGNVDNVICSFTTNTVCEASTSSQTSSSSESTCLPGQPCGSSSSEATTSSQTSSSSETTSSSVSSSSEISSSSEASVSSINIPFPGQGEENGNVEEENGNINNGGNVSSSSESSVSSECLPGQPCGSSVSSESSSSSVSSSESTSSSEASSSSTTTNTGEGAFPQLNSSSSSVSSSESTSSSEASSSSTTTNTGEGAFPQL